MRGSAKQSRVAGGTLDCFVAIAPRNDVAVGRPNVGWIERSETHRSQHKTMMGFATLYPSYALTFQACRDRELQSSSDSVDEQARPILKLNQDLIRSMTPYDLQDLPVKQFS